MSTLTSYNGLKVVTPTPSGMGGAAINNNFIALSTNIAMSDPTVGDDSTLGFSEGSRWYNSSTTVEWLCTDPTPSAAVWKVIGSSKYLPTAGGTMTGALVIGAAIDLGGEPIYTYNWTVQEVSGEVFQFLNTDGGGTIGLTSLGGASFTDTVDMGANKIQLDAATYIQADGSGNITISTGGDVGLVTVYTASLNVPNGMYNPPLYYASNYKPLILSTPPASSSASGTQWTWTCDANYIYICTATNTWKRVALSTF